MDSKKILAKHNVDRAPVSLRIDKKLWGEFNAVRGAAEQNKLIEDLIREFLAGLKEKEK